jgi:hypothetical protein
LIFTLLEVASMRARAGKNDGVRAFFDQQRIIPASPEIVSLEIMGGVSNPLGLYCTILAFCQIYKDLFPIPYYAKTMILASY